MAQPFVKKDDDHDDESTSSSVFLCKALDQIRSFQICAIRLEYSPFMGIEKGAVLQEARVFNDAQVDPRRCSQVITKLLYLLNQGESFTKVCFTFICFLNIS
ncbi:hypothetical protein F2Q69_00009589 [Brassica cretica]|uniref:Uncharacterized protein n=1 Tax=Brassica cretica TaxID=69181 RepID=A0A8S9NQJ3_BRACR|nr:hypothetical protein F2Q69_00009589 [Brassica cretica]